MLSGRYIRLWINGENYGYLQNYGNIGGTINRAISLYSNSHPVLYYASPLPKVISGSITTSAAWGKIPKNSLTCPNGHIVKDGDYCIISTCQYSKELEGSHTNPYYEDE